MKPLRAVVIQSTTRPGMLSMRLNEDDATGTSLLRALAEAGFRPGDVVELSLVRSGPEVAK